MSEKIPCLIMYRPAIVPIKTLALLNRVGLDTTDKVHAAIRSNSLRKYKGIGPKSEEKIIRYYTL